MTWRSGFNSRLVFMVTLASTILFPLQYAVFVGIFLSLFFFLRITAKPDLTQLVPRANGRFDEVPFERAARAPIVLVNLEGDLYFAAVENLDYELERILAPETRVVVLRMKRLRAVGSSAMAILDRFRAMLQARNVVLVLCGVEPELRDVMTRSGLRERIGEPNIFYADNTLFQSTQLAMARARNILEMERWREAPPPRIDAEAARLAPRIRARDLMSRQCIRFGEEHSLREAVWLMSEMFRRGAAAERQPLFLQDRRGKLAGALSPEDILREMTREIDPQAADQPSDQDLGRLMRRPFDELVRAIARSQLPAIRLESALPELLRGLLADNLPALPVCDEDQRVVGLLTQHDLLLGVSKLPGMFQKPQEGPRDETGVS
jgi:anti-anti-sigma factor